MMLLKDFSYINYDLFFLTAPPTWECNQEVVPHVLEARHHEGGHVVHSSVQNVQGQADCALDKFIIG